MSAERKIYNPIQKDYVTFLKTSDETGGECTLVEVELAPKGGVGLHYHKTYIEKFGWMSAFEFILRKQAKKARTKGVDKILTEKYVKF